MSSPFCKSWFNLARLIALLIAFAVGCSLLIAQSGSGDSPVPIQRIFLKPDRVAKVLEEVQQGTLVLLPRAEFEKRVERVGKALQERGPKPHLTRAHYSAELVDRSFTNGSGRWTILHSSGEDAILSMESLNLALAKVRWEQGGDAILAELDGKSLGLMVKPAGKQTCLFDWSARGTPTNDGITFNLTVPPCPISTFEFKLPADYWFTAAKGTIVVTGPHETETPRDRLWKMQVAGTTPVEFSVRKIAASPGLGPTLFARVHSTQKLYPDRIEVEHEYQVDILHGSVRELILEGDASLQPFAVSLPGSEVKLGPWKKIDAKKDAKNKLAPSVLGQVAIHFTQPTQGKIQGLRVKSLAPRSPATVWTSPAMGVRDAQSRGETLDVWLHADLRLGTWDSGSFQATHIVTESDGTQTIALAQTAVEPEPSRRPTFTSPSKEIDLHTTENYLWQITQRGATLAAEIHYAPTRGSLFELRVKLPKKNLGYQIESLEMQPAEMLAAWHPEPDGASLVVELKQALTPAKQATLRIQLRTGLRELTTGTHILSYPELEPDDATKRAGAPAVVAKREGTLAIVVDPVFRARLKSASAPLAPFADAERDQRQAPPSYRFSFRDQRLSAEVELEPQPVQIQLRGQHTITLTQKHAALRFRWDAQPLVGTPEFLDFRMAPGFPLAWKVNAADDTMRIQHWERLFLQESLPHLLHLGSTHPIHAGAVESMLPTGEYWRFYLAEPLRKKAGFTLQTEAPAGDALPRGAKAWSVPLMVPMQRSNVDQEFTVDSPGEPITNIAAEGSLQVDGIAPAAGKTSPQVRLHQVGSPIPPAPRITVTTQPGNRPTAQLAMCDEASLATFVYKDGRVEHRIRFRLWHWRDRACDLQLPAGFHVVGVKLNAQNLQSFTTHEGESLLLTMPVDQNVDFVRYEILARRGSGQGFFPGLVNVEVPRVGWPSAPLEIRTRFFLEKGWAPLTQDSLTPVGVPAKIARQTATPRWLRQMWSAVPPWVPFGEGAALREKLENQRRAVLSAESKFRAANQAMKLSQALERFALNHLKDAAPLVIDRVALHALGLSGDTALSNATLSPQAGPPFWEALGLIYLPCPSGALLTSPERLESLGITSTAQTADLEEAVQEAILNGRDASAGFYLILNWLRLSSETHHFGESTASGAGPDRDFLDMNEWVSNAGEVLPAQFYVIDRMIARVVGWMLAVFAALILWRFHSSVQAKASFRGYVLLLAGSVLLVIWSPGNVREYFVLPVLGVEIVGFLWCIVRFVYSADDSTPAANSTLSQPAAATAAFVLLFLGATWNLPAQVPAPRPYTVFVLDGDKPAVLAPPDLLAKLDELESPSAAGTAGAVLVSAQYTGKIKGTNAKFDVVYEIQSLKDKANLVIPLTGVQLHDSVFLDGTPAFPAPHKTGFLLPIRDKGPHTVRLSFSARAAADDDQLKLSFTIPKLVQNEIRIEGLTPAQKLYCLHCFGEEKWLHELSTKVWHANLGYESVVHLRWTNTTPNAAPRKVEVKEAHFWDLHPAAPALTSSLTYAIGNGSLASLRVAMPEGLLVRSVEVRRASGPTGAGAPVVIEHWAVQEDGQRRLTVDLAQPITGDFTLNLEIVPQAIAKKGEHLLFLPTPLQGEAGAGLLGYRLNAKEVARFAPNLSVASVNADDFEIMGKKPPVPVSHAYSFKRNAPNAMLKLITQPNAWQAQGHLQWTVDHHHADVSGKITFSSFQADLILLELFIDKSMILAEVAGPDVRRWQLQENLLQVWLRQPRKEATLTLTGWRSTPVVGPIPKEKSFALPCIYPLHTQPGGVTLEVRPAGGTYLKLAKIQRLRSNLAVGYHFTITGPSYEAAFLLGTENKPPQASMLTKVQQSEQGIEVRHTIRLKTERGRLPSVILHLHDWPYDGMVPDAPGGVVTLLKSKTFKHPAWTLKYPPDLPQEVLVTMRGRIANDKHASISLPFVELENVAVHDRWLAWNDLEIIQVIGGKKLTAQKSVKEKIASSLGERWFNDISSWHYAAAVRSLKAAAPKTMTGTSVRVLSSSEVVRLVGEGRWLHEASYWIHAPESTELRVRFPAPVETMSVWMNRRRQAALNPNDLNFSLSLEASPEPHFVELRWQYAETTERIVAPSIAAVQFEQAPLPAHERIAWIPRGMSASNPDAAPVLLSTLLHEARGHVQIAAVLAEAPARSIAITKQIASHQQNFFACARQLEYALLLVRNVHPDFDEALWLNRLQDLKRQNADFAKERRYDEQRRHAEKATTFALASAVRERNAALGMPMLLPANLPSLLLQSESARLLQQQRIRSELLLLGVIFLLVFSLFRHGWSILRLAAPELVLALIALAMVLDGISLIGIFLIGSMVLVRALWVLAAVKQRFTPTVIPEQGNPTLPA